MLVISFPLSGAFPFRLPSNELLYLFSSLTWFVERRE